MSSQNLFLGNDSSDTKSVANRPVLVMGARGNIGGLIVDPLRARGVRVRASSRSGAPADFPPGVDGVRADLTDAAS